MLSVLLLALLFLTNRYLSLGGDRPLIEYAGLDSFSYLEIAKAFPHLPSSGAEIPFHHAQRGAFPYLIGGLSSLTGIPLETSFFISTILLIILAVFLFNRLLSELALPRAGKNILLLFLVLSPYTFRYYIAIPFILNDLFFQVGLVLVILSLVKQNQGMTFLGFILTVLSRQTALLIIPLILCWTFLVWPRSANALRKNIYFSVAILLAGFSIYKVSGSLAATFSGPNANVAHVVGLANWARTAFDMKVLSEFIVRGLMPFMIPLFFILAFVPRFSSAKGKNSQRTKIILLFGTVFLICSQPFLGGPLITGPNITRLNCLAIIPFLTALGLGFKEHQIEDRLLELVFPFGCLIVSLGSFHHVFSFLGGYGSQLALNFTIIHFCLAIFLFLIVLYFRFYGQSLRGSKT